MTLACRSASLGVRRRRARRGKPRAARRPVPGARLCSLCFLCAGFRSSVKPAATGGEGRRSGGAQQGDARRCAAPSGGLYFRAAGSIVVVLLHLPCSRLGATEQTRLMGFLLDFLFLFSVGILPHPDIQKYSEPSVAGKAAAPLPVGIARGMPRHAGSAQGPWEGDGTVSIALRLWKVETVAG